MRCFIQRILLTMLGLFVFSIGEYTTIQAGIGLSPWTCLSMGLADHLPSMTYGTVHVCISLLIVLFDYLLGEKIGFGTLLDAVEVGLSVDLIRSWGLIPQITNQWIGIPVICAGLMVMAFGQFIYMKQGLGCGPRDSLTVGIGRKLPKAPIGAVQIVILLLALSGGWLLGGPVGIGTAITSFGIGICMQIVFRILHFEPRSVTHEHVLQTLKAIRS